MELWVGILSLVTAVVSAIAVYLKMRNDKGPQAGVEEKKAEVRDEMDHFKKTGRPK